ncbi:MAG: riboflavin synthase [SAR202 cluster bacterium]|nr:riboflavin synthase [Chloroflexota bacterium]MQG22398.1 riboflavin synthase [SAR202 cluster bacterium]|tara:strand:- start:933 stop:1511 length:579 start_codon:yes stop_codon:yes gene_type:complete
MFTGIIEEVSTVNRLSDAVLSINSSLVIDDLEIKDSICVNGACLTVIDKTNKSFDVNVVPETMRRTNLGEVSRGDLVNLERSTSVNGRLGGHIVQGHVDGMGVIRSIVADGDAFNISFDADKSILKYIVEKGFICIDGISLTVTYCDDTSFGITLIPYTYSNTTLGDKDIGDTVNLECDIIGKYVEKLVNHL